MHLLSPLCNRTKAGKPRGSGKYARTLVLFTAICSPLAASAQQNSVPLEVWGVSNGILPQSKIWKFRESDEDNDLQTANAASPTLNDQNWESVELRWKERPGRDVANHFRKQFTLDEIGVELAQITGIQVSIQYDDTAVMYLNGVEVYRSIRGNLDPTYSRYPLSANIPYDVDIDFGGFEEFYVDVPNINGTNDCEQIDDCERSPYGGPDTPEIPLSLLRDGVNTWAVTTWNRSSGGTGDSSLNHTFTLLVDDSLTDTAPVYINEVVAGNDSVYEVELEGELENPDYIEFYNDSDVPVDLEGWTISDDSASWTFPAVTIAAFDYLVIAANDEDRKDTTPLQTNFKLSLEGDNLRLTDPGGFLADEYAVIPTQLEDGAYGRANDNSELDATYLDSATPGARNSARATNTLPNLQFIADKIYNAGEALSEQVGAFDPDGDTLTYSFSPRPPGVGIDSTGLIVGAPTRSGTFDSVISVTDDDANTISQPVRITVVPAPTASPALVLNEYNAVSKKSELTGGSEVGNGGNWFEFIVTEDSLDLRGMSIELYDNQGDDDQLRLAAQLTFINDPLLAALPAGLIITISEDQPDDLAFDQLIDWHINFQVDGDANGTYFIPGDGDFDSTHKGQAVLVRNAAGEVVSPLSGETSAWSVDGGVSKEEAMALCINPVEGFTLEPVQNYNDVGTASSFGRENTCSNDDNTPYFQNLAALRFEFESFSTASTIARGDDDAEERDDGEVDLGSKDIELAKDRDARTIGLRFTDLDVPAGAIVERAYIQFQAEDTESDTTQLSIAAEASSNAAPFTESDNNISSRERTAMSIDWSPTQWRSKGQRSDEQQTPDLSTMVQSIVNRGDWNRGQAMAFIITGNGERVAESYEGERDGAATLVIEYSADANLAPTAQVQASPATGVFPFTAQFSTNGTSDDGIIVRYDWDFGNGNSLNGGASSASNTYTEAGTFTARVTVSDERGKRSSADVQITVLDPNRPINIVSTIASGNDDAEQTSNGDMNLSSRDLEPGDAGSREQAVGLRFTDLDIPAGALITNAYIQFQAEDDKTGTARYTIRGNDSSDAAPFSTRDNDLSSRSLTTASVQWTVASWQDKGDQSTAQRTPDLSTIVQSIVNDGNWDSGQAMAFFVYGSGERSAESYEGDRNGAARLHVTYTAGVVTAPQARIQADPVTSLDPSTVASVDSGTDTSVTGSARNAVNDGTDRVIADDVAIPAPPVAIVPPAIVSAQFAINTGSDDAEEFADSRMYLDSSDIELSEDRGPQTVGLRFTGVDIGRGATIKSATIQFTAKEASAGTSDLEIAMQTSDNAPLFSTASGNITNRPVSDSINWKPANWISRGAQGSDQRTPELASLVQQIVDRNDWTSGNALAFIISGTGTRFADSYEGNQNSAAVLNIEYSFDGNQPPVARASAQPTRGNFPLTVSYDASLSSDDAEIVSYDWSFSDGDGGFELEGQISPSITYQNAGTYAATVTVTDAAGKSSVQSIEIVVTDPNAP